MGTEQLPFAASCTPGLQSPHSPRRSLASEAMAGGPTEELNHFAAEKLFLSKCRMPEGRSFQVGGAKQESREEGDPSPRGIFSNVTGTSHPFTGCPMFYRSPPPNQVCKAFLIDFHPQNS